MHRDISCDDAWHQSSEYLRRCRGYLQFINYLDQMRMRTDDNGLPCGTNCTYYGYCLMTNHFHLLIREREEKVGETVKRIASSYVYYYNKKYGRDGHLFQQ